MSLTRFIFSKISSHIFIIKINSLILSCINNNHEDQIKNYRRVFKIWKWLNWVKNKNHFRVIESWEKIQKILFILSSMSIWHFIPRTMLWYGTVLVRRQIFPFFTNFWKKLRKKMKIKTISIWWRSNFPHFQHDIFNWKLNLIYLYCHQWRD